MHSHVAIPPFVSAAAKLPLQLLMLIIIGKVSIIIWGQVLTDGSVRRQPENNLQYS
jgi:hypothetical protein